MERRVEGSHRFDLEGQLESSQKELEQLRGGLEQARARLAEVVASTMDAIIATNDDFRIVLCNPAAGRMFGCDPEAALGQRIDQFIPTDVRARHRQLMTGMGVETGAPHAKGPRQVMALRADGSEFPIEASISVAETPEGRLYTAFVRDMSQVRQAEAALRRSEAGLLRAQDVAQLAHAVVDAQGKVESRSDSFLRLLGIAPDGDVGLTIADWFARIHPDDLERVREIAARSWREAARADFEYRLRGRDGWHDVLHIIEPLLETQSSPDGLRTFNTIQNITGLKLAEARIRRLNRVWAVLSGISSLIVHAQDREALFQGACQIAVDVGGFSKAWIGYVEGEGEPMRIITWSGADEAFMANLKRRLAEDPAEFTGVIAAALVAVDPVICNDIANDPRILGREELVASGSRSLGLFPLRVAGRNVGVISLHAPVAGFFDEEETTLLLRLAADVSYALDHQYKSDQLHYLGNHDPVTELPNRRQFLERLDRLVGAGSGSATAVVLMDLVRFRHVNESLGRRHGDAVLRELARRLRDANPTAARLGSDVFAVRIDGRDSVDEIAREIEQLMAGFCDVSLEVEGSELRTGCRFGIAVHPADGDDGETLVNKAEVALRRAKESSAPFVFYAPDMTQAANEFLSLEHRLRRAVERQEFVLYYQPKIRLRDGQICGAEALIRWQDPEHGLIPPLKFIPLLEQTGLIDAVGRWALGQAMTDRDAWIAAGAPALPIAVNVSPLQLDQSDFAAQVAEAMNSRGETAMELEITENVIMTNVSRKVAILEQVRKLGVAIAIDDFGTGYSSLSYIAKLPITSLKIDRAFINDVGANPAGYTLVSSIIALAHALHLKVVAEGVETDEQSRLLKLLSCDEAQGYLYSRPVPGPDFLSLLL